MLKIANWDCVAASGIHVSQINLVLDDVNLWHLHISCEEMKNDIKHKCKGQTHIQANFRSVRLLPINMHVWNAKLT